MPIYEYQCQHCRKELEILQKISDSPLQDCPECGKPALKKKISAAAFRLKGGGWYETDFKTGGKKNLAGDSEGKTSTTSDGPSSTPGDDKPAKSGAGESKNTA
jgi:putative FmdB family regulatory protein